MKPPFQQLPGGFRALFVLILSLLSTAVWAQSDYYARTDSNRAYWKIQTDATRQKTLIRFFNNQHEPIYQETLPGRYVKLTNRNIRRFDEILDRLTTNQLVAAAVKSHALSASSAEGVYSTATELIPDPVTTTYILDSSDESAKFVPMRSDVSINDVGKLKLHVLNSLEKTLLITLMDEQGRYVYKEKVASLNYNRILNLTKLHEGKFTLEISGTQREYHYRLTIQQTPRLYQLRAIR